MLASSDAVAREKAARLSAPPSALVGAPSTVADALRAYLDAGADWLVLGPVDSSDPANAALTGEVRAHLVG